MTDWITAIAAAIGVPGLGLAAALAIRQLRESARTRHAELLGDLSRRWDEPLLSKARGGLAMSTREQLVELVEAAYDKRDENAIDRLRDLEALPNFCELLGTLESHGSALPLELVDGFWGSAIMTAWGDWEAAIRAIRKHPDAHTAYANFEQLQSAIRERRVRSDSEASGPVRSESSGL